MATKKENFTEIVTLLDAAGRTELADVMRHELDLLNSRSGANKKLTDAQKKNLELMDTICEILETQGAPMSISQLMAAEALNDIKSNQHCNSLLIKLRREGRVKHIPTKEGTLFTLGNENEAEPEQ